VLPFRTNQTVTFQAHSNKPVEGFPDQGFYMSRRQVAAQHVQCSPSVLASGEAATRP
jgi:hypothetical protein